MKKKSDSKKVNKALIGGAVGIGAIALYLALRKKENSLEHIGTMISHVGEILANHQIEDSSIVKEFDKKIHQNEDTVSEVVDWAATTISLWKKFKK